jgi:hypothetical protein
LPRASASRASALAVISSRASELGWVDAQEAAAGAGVFVDARCVVGGAVAEGDLAEQEVLFELGPLVAGGGALLGAVAQLAATFDEGFVGGDEVFGEDGGVAAGGVEAEVAEQGRGDVQREADADEFGGEQAPEVVRGESDGLAVEFLSDVKCGMGSRLCYGRVGRWSAMRLLVSPTRPRSVFGAGPRVSRWEWCSARR